MHTHEISRLLGPRLFFNIAIADFLKSEDQG